jgi:hypothetical protein
MFTLLELSPAYNGLREEYTDRIKRYYLPISQDAQLPEVRAEFPKYVEVGSQVLIPHFESIVGY